MSKVELIALNEHPYRAGGEKFSRPAPDAERLIRNGWACLPENYEAPVIIDVSPRPLNLTTPKAKAGKKQDKKITVYMATFPGRKRCLSDSVPSLLPQVDEFNLWLNGYDKKDPLPEFLNDPKIKLHYGQDVGDVGKFMLINEWQGYVFTCDDKLIYPPDYVHSMIEKIEEHKRKAVISAHGRNLKHPAKSYYFDHLQFFGCLETVKSDVFVEEIGTGAMAFHASTVNGLQLAEFKFTNMTDILFSIWLNDCGIPRMVIAHNAGWIQGSRNLKPPSISTTHNKNDGLHTEIINAVNWKIHEPTH